VEDALDIHLFDKPEDLHGSFNTGGRESVGSNLWRRIIYLCSYDMMNEWSIEHHLNVSIGESKQKLNSSRILVPVLPVHDVVNLP
jgi:hypothetical protein